MRRFFLLTGLTFALTDLSVAQAVTYDYTGTVTEADGIFSSVALGATVTGTYTFDFANANPSQSAGVVGSPQNWLAAEAGHNVPTVALVFSSTAEVDGITYLTQSNAGFEQANITGYGNYDGPTFVGVELSDISALAAQASELTLVGNSQPWSSTGLPLLNRASVMAFGTFEDIIGPQESVVGFNVTSLTPAAGAPEIDASGMTSALTLLLGGVAALRKSSRPLANTPAKVK